jgi:hypothetical protein
MERPERTIDRTDAMLEVRFDETARLLKKFVLEERIGSRLRRNPGFGEVSADPLELKGE